VTLKNEVAGRLVLLAAPYLWRRYRTKAYIGLGAGAGLIIVYQAVKRLNRGGEDDRKAIRDRIVEPLPAEQRGAPTPTPEAFVDTDQRDD
jgi:hypothetical protein